MNIVQTAIVTSDTAVSTKHSKVWWVSVSAGATGGAFQLNDSGDDSGTDKLDLTIAANSSAHFNFGENPVEFHSGLYCDVPGTNLKVNIGYTD